MKNRAEITDGIVNWLYQHSSGTLAHVVFLYYTAQEISILDGREIIDIQALESAYQRMEMLHMHIQPEVSMKKIASKRKKNTSVQVISETTEKKEENAIASDEALDVVEEHPASRGNSVDWSFEELMKEAKKSKVDMLELLQGKISITEVVM